MGAFLLFSVVAYSLIQSVGVGSRTAVDADQQLSGVRATFLAESGLEYAMGKTIYGLNVLGEDATTTCPNVRSGTVGFPAGFVGRWDFSALRGTDPPDTTFACTFEATGSIGTAASADYASRTLRSGGNFSYSGGVVHNNSNSYVVRVRAPLGQNYFGLFNGAVAAVPSSSRAVLRCNGVECAEDAWRSEVIAAGASADSVTSLGVISALQSSSGSYSSDVCIYDGGSKPAIGACLAPAANAGRAGVLVGVVVKAATGSAARAYATYPAAASSGKKGSTSSANAFVSTASTPAFTTGWGQWCGGEPVSSASGTTSPVAMLGNNPLRAIPDQATGNGRPVTAIRVTLANANTLVKPGEKVRFSGAGSLWSFNIDSTEFTVFNATSTNIDLTPPAGMVCNNSGNPASRRCNNALGGNTVRLFHQDLDSNFLVLMLAGRPDTGESWSNTSGTILNTSATDTASGVLLNLTRSGTSQPIGFHEFYHYPERGEPAVTAPPQQPYTGPVWAETHTLYNPEYQGVITLTRSGTVGNYTYTGQVVRGDLPKPCTYLRVMTESGLGDASYISATMHRRARVVSVDSINSTFIVRVAKPFTSDAPADCADAGNYTNEEVGSVVASSRVLSNNLVCGGACALFDSPPAATTSVTVNTTQPSLWVGGMSCLNIPNLDTANDLIKVIGQVTVSSTSWAEVVPN